MFIQLTTYGTFYFFTAVTLLGLVWAWLFLPELAGKSLESIDAVFNLPWWQIGLKGKYVAMDEHGDTFETADTSEPDEQESGMSKRRDGSSSP